MIRGAGRWFGILLMGIGAMFLLGGLLGAGAALLGVLAS